MTTRNPNKHSVANAIQHGYSSDHKEENLRVIAAYRSHRAGEHWDAIAPFVRASANRLADNSKRIPKVTLGMLSRFALWAYQHGIPLDRPEDVLNAPNLRRFAEEGMQGYKASSYEIRLLHIQRIIGAIGDNDPSYPRRPGRQDYFADREVYTLEDQAMFISSRRNRKTAHQRNNFSVYIGLGFGAGLTTQELVDIRTRHITEENGRLVARVGGENPRTVPIRHAWADILLEGLGGRAPDDFAIIGWRHPTEADRLPTAIGVAGRPQPHPKPTVMRSTWIVEQLVAGVRPDVVAEAAGTPTVKNYLWRMPAYNYGDYLDQLAGTA